VSFLTLFLLRHLNISAEMH